MKLTEYIGRRLHLRYPSFLKVKHEDPQWLAMGPKSSCPVVVFVDPDPSTAEAYARVNRDPKITSVPGMTVDIMRDDELQTPNELVAHGRLIKMTNGIGEVFWNWTIVGKIRSHTIIVQIDCPNDKWEQGGIWEAFINSIQLLETTTAERDK